MLFISRKILRSSHIFLALCLISVLVLWAVKSASLQAQTFTQRSIIISSGVPSAVVTNVFQFTYPSTSSVGSVVLEYCENSPVFAYACDMPAGLDVSSASLDSQAGNVGFSIDAINTTANKLVLTRVPVASAAVASSYSLSNVTNPSTAQNAVFIRISTYASVDGTGPFIDNGAVAFATVTPLNVDAFVPPYLRFCVGITVDPNCSSMTGNSIDLGELSSTSANADQSQFSTGTNSTSGYVVFGLGTTMTSGNYTIPAMASPTSSSPGSSQFGINLRANSIPSVGQEPFGSGTATVVSNYNFPNFFMYNPGDALVSSTQPTNYNRMTVSYLVNVNKDQTPGVYSTTITYMATAQY